MEMEDIFTLTPEAKKDLLLNQLIRSHKMGTLAFKVQGDTIVWNDLRYTHFINLTKDAILVDGSRMLPKSEAKQDYIELAQFLFSHLSFFNRVKVLLTRNR